MEFTNFPHNIKMETGGMGGWPGAVAATTPPHSDKKVIQNPFMQWAVAINSVQGFYFTPQQPGPGTGSTPPSDLSGGSNSADTKQDDQSRPASVNVSDSNRQPVQSMAPGHYNHSLHPMVPVDPNVHHQHPQQQQQQHHQQHQQQSANQGGLPAHPPTNDTAFPGGHHRQNYNVGPGGAGHAQMIHNHLNNKISGDPKSSASSVTKNKLYTEENGQVVTFNGSQEHMEMTRRGVKIERVYECKDCDKAFTREEHLKRHAKSHTDEPVHRCEVEGCTKAYTRKERLTRHYKVAHLGQEPERPFFCNVCGKDFQRKEHLNRHQKNLHGVGVPHNMLHNHQGGGQQNHNTTDGPISMTVLNPLNTNTHHGGGGGGGAGGGNHTQAVLHCTYEGCPKTYSRREHLNRHIKLHMGIEPERPYYCMECGKTFTRKEHLMRHRRSHTGETPFACPDCSKQFARKEHLKRHMRVHTGEHPYPCSECGRSFGRRERLLKHLKSHGIGVMPGVRPQYQQPKKIEFKKEPDFNAEYSDPHTMTHGVFGDQTNHLLRMIAQKGPLSPEQLGLPQTPIPTEQVFNNPEVARALSNPEIVRAFQNPEIVKAFALSPPKKSATSPGGTLSQATLTTVQVSSQSTNSGAPAVTRGPDIANSPSVPPELSKLPSGFSIFPVVPSTGSAGQDQGSQVCQVSNNGATYYQAGPSYVAPGHGGRGAELTTIPMTAWPAAWHVSQPVNMRQSPAKVEPAEPGKHWEPTAAAAYFRAPFP